jgi:sortase A
VKQNATLRRALGFILVLSGLAVAITALFGETIESQVAATTQTSKAGELQDQFARAGDGRGSSSDDKLDVGETFAILYAPRLGEDFRRPIAQGTSVEKVLNTVGIGHYSTTAMPGEDGNVALASHRTTHGGAFNHIDQFQLGDHIVVETAAGWFVYEVVDSVTVKASDLWVIGANPLDRPETKWLTLTTCTPRYTSDKRLAVWAKQVRQIDRADGPPSIIAHLVENAG